MNLDHKGVGMNIDPHKLTLRQRLVFGGWADSGKSYSLYQVCQALVRWGFDLNMSPFGLWLLKGPFDPSDMTFYTSSDTKSAVVVERASGSLYLLTDYVVAPGLPEYVKKCDCGATHTREPHYDWCSVARNLD